MTTMPTALSGLLPLLDELRAVTLPPPHRRQEIRCRARVSQRQLAKAIGTAQRNISNWERGYVEPTPAFRLAYRVALEHLEQLVLEQSAGAKTQE